jgi:hypothetical protein
LALLPEVKRRGCDVDHSPPQRAEVENEWSFSSTPILCLHGVGRELAETVEGGQGPLWAVVPQEDEEEEEVWTRITLLSYL